MAKKKPSQSKATAERQFNGAVNKASRDMVFGQAMVTHRLRAEARKKKKAAKRRGSRK